MKFLSAVFPDAGIKAAEVLVKEFGAEELIHQVLGAPDAQEQLREAVTARQAKSMVEFWKETFQDQGGPQGACVWSREAWGR